MVIDYSKLKKILIIRLSSFGDILLTTPVIRSIKKINPGLQIDFVLKKEFFELLQFNPYITDIYKYSKNDNEIKSLISTLAQNKYDLVIDLQNNFRSGKMTEFLKADVVRFRKNNLKKFLLVHFKTNKLKEAPPIPLRYAEAAEVELDNDGLDFFTNCLPDSKLNKDENYIGLCPGAKHFTKRWPEEYFIQLGKMLEAEGYKILLFGSLEEKEFLSEAENYFTGAVNLCCDSFLQTGANMKLCKAVYTNDSGTMHLASAMKVPLIAFFGSTVKEFGFFPYKARSIVLENKNLSCRPCTHIGRKSCPKTHFKCMKEIKPEMAFNSLRNVLVS
jgi:heptosyltransferase-2